MDLRVESKNLAMAPRWKAEIEKRMADLQAGHDDILHGRVTLTKNRRHKKLDQVAEAVIIVNLPRRRTFTARKTEKTFEEAIRAAFAAIETELERFRAKRASTEIRLAPLPHYGVVSKVFRRQDYGFILQDGGGEVYFHRNALHDLEFDRLEDGQEVVFEMEEGKKGPQATAVEPTRSWRHHAHG